MKIEDLEAAANYAVNNFGKPDEFLISAGHYNTLSKMFIDNRIYNKRYRRIRDMIQTLSLMDLTTLQITSFEINEYEGFFKKLGNKGWRKRKHNL